MTMFEAKTDTPAPNPQLRALLDEIAVRARAEYKARDLYDRVYGSMHDHSIPGRIDKAYADHGVAEEQLEAAIVAAEAYVETLR